MNTVIVCPNPSDNSGGGSSVVTANLATPIGNVEFSASMRNPEGHLIADGCVYSKLAFPDLYAALGSNYNSVRNSYAYEYDANRDFAVPPMLFTAGNTTKLFPTSFNISYINGSTNVINNLTGGSDIVTLDVSNIPQHKHDTFATQGNGYTAADGGNGNRANSGILSGSLIYDSNNTLIVNGAPSPFSIVPNFLGFNSLIRADTPDVNSVPGFVNINSSNNGFYLTLLTNSTNLPTPSPADFTTFAITLASGSFSRAALLSNMATSIKNSVNSYSGTSGVVMTMCDLTGYAINNVGQYTFKLYMNYTPPYGDFAYYQINFISSNLYPSNTLGYIPIEVLDKTANTLGWNSRSLNPTINSFTDASFSANALGGSIVSPPKAMSINYDGSIQNGDFSSSNFNFINTY